MPRKSRELRLSQTVDLIAAYDAAGLSSDRSYRFMIDMKDRLERGKGLSTGQRNYIDNLIEQGVPTPKNTDRVNEILEASRVDGMQNDAKPLKDFAYKIGKGWSLSEKQEAFLAKLMKKAEDLKVNGRFRPEGQLLSDITNAAEILKHKNSWYFSHRPGTGRALESVSKWLQWKKWADAYPDAAGAHSDQYPEPLLDEWVCNKVASSAKTDLKAINNPKFVEGSFAYANFNRKVNSFALITGAPYAKKGVVVYPCLIDGEELEVPVGNLKKRRSK